MADPLSYREYVATNGQTNFPVAMPYLKTDHIHVLTGENPVLDADIAWINPGLISIPPQVAGTVVHVYRLTPNVEPNTTFQPGTMKSDDMNQVVKQLLYIIQENGDLATVTAGRLEELQELADEVALNTQIAQAAAALAQAGAGAPVFETKAVAQAYNPAVSPAYIDLAFYDTAQTVGSGARYRKVASQPSHFGKLQLANGQWYEIAEPEVHIAMLGAKMDNTTDDADAVERSHGVGRPLRAGPGFIRLGRVVEFNTGNPIILRGTGSDVTTGHTNTTTFVGDHNGTFVFSLNGSSDYANTSFVLEGFEVCGKVSGPPNNQHGIVLKKYNNWGRFNDLCFDKLTGYAIAEDPTTNAYAQNISIRDCSYVNVGGQWGLTSEPTVNQHYAAGNLLEINNTNMDGGINTQSPQKYLWDFRGFLMVNSTTYLMEGTGSAAITAMIGICAGAHLTFNNNWHEFTTNNPQYWLHVASNAEGRFIGATETFVKANGMISGSKVLFDSGVEGHVTITDLADYLATSVDDLVTFAGNAGFLRLVDLHVKTPFRVPEHLIGKVDIVSFNSMDATAPPLERGGRPIASWRCPPSGTVFLPQHTMRFQTGFVSTSAAEGDNNDTRLLVWRATSVAGDIPTPFIFFEIPFDWWEVTVNYNAQSANFTKGSVLVGATSGAKARILSDADAGTTGALKVKMLTATNFSSGETITDAAGGSATVNGAVTRLSPWFVFVIRWKLTLSDADDAAGTYGRWDYPTASIVINRSNQNHNDEYLTSIFQMRVTAAAPSLGISRAGPAPASPAVMRLAAVDLYLGNRWNEPLDLPYI